MRLPGVRGVGGSSAKDPLKPEKPQDAFAVF